MELIGFALPILIDLINRKIEDKDARFWVSFLVCTAVGMFINFTETYFVFDTVRAGFESITASIMVVFGLSQLTYKGIYENTQLQAKIRS